MKQSSDTFITYPYEWPFSILKEAALLHLNIFQSSITNKKPIPVINPFLIQWIGLTPICDNTNILSEEHTHSAYLIAYEQFREMYLMPLMITAHLGIDYQPIFRSQKLGITRKEAKKYFRWSDFWKNGVLSEILFPNCGCQIKSISSKKMLSLIKKLKIIIKNLTLKDTKDIWNQYTSKQYESNRYYFQTKINAVKSIMKASYNNMETAWDLGANDGTFSKIIAPKVERVLAIDGSHYTVESMYHKIARQGIPNITPLVIDISNISPTQGWRGREYKAFDQRKRVDLILCLAVIHHMRVANNIPLTFLFDWIRKQNARIIIEFVDRADDMFQQLIANKEDTYSDYTIQNFVLESKRRFNIASQHKLSATRELFDLRPII